MRISIIVPPFDYGRMLYGMLRARAFHNAVPLGAVSVAAALREAGHDVMVLDCPALGSTEDDVVEALRSFRPDTIGISSTSVIWRSAASLSKALKAIWKIPIFIGGPHPSLFPDHALETSAADAVIVGEGEESAVDLVEAFAAGGTGEALAGVVVRSPTGPRKGPPRVARRELDEMPLPAYDLLELHRYSAPPMRVRNTPALYMEMFRGCAYAQCTYCTSAIGLKNRFRRHSPAVAAEKVAAIAGKYGAREIAFVDDDFVVGKDWIHDFSHELRTRSNPVTWTCYVRASQVDAQVFASMAAAGCHQVLIGMEVLDNDALKTLSKDLTVASCAEAVRAAHSAGISVIGLFMCGVPGTSPRHVEDSVEHALAQRVDVAVWSLYRPLPGTPTWDALGWGPEEYIDGFKLQKEAVFVPETFRDKRHVEATFQRAYRQFYLDRRFIEHTLTRTVRDPYLLRQVWNGAMTLADQFRPRLLRPAARA